MIHFLIWMVVTKLLFQFCCDAHKHHNKGPEVTGTSLSISAERPASPDLSPNRRPPGCVLTEAREPHLSAASRQNPPSAGLRTGRVSGNPSSRGPARLVTRTPASSLGFFPFSGHFGPVSRRGEVLRRLSQGSGERRLSGDAPWSPTHPSSPQNPGLGLGLSAATQLERGLQLQPAGPGPPGG